MDNLPPILDISSSLPQYPIHYQLMYVLPLKYVFNWSTSFCFHCYHPRPSYKYFSYGQLLLPAFCLSPDPGQTLCQSVFLLCSQSWSFQNQNLLSLISLAKPPSGLHCSWVGTWACNVTSTALHCLASACISRPFLHHIPSSHTSLPPPPGMCRTSFLHKPWTATSFPKLCCLLTLSWANL